ncbi:MAG: hypothetical protein ABW252_20650 [Polyangiales bacterium]
MRSNQERLGTWLLSTVLLGTAAVAVGCDDDEDVMESVDGGTSNPNGLLDASTGSTGGDGGVAQTGNCPAVSARTEEVVPANITTNTTWTCQKKYVLNSNVFVKGGATLTIQPGTVVQGSSEGALFITREGKIDAAGTKDAPIVFTSYQAEGQRKRGDWKGVVLLGNASINAISKDTVFEGLDPLPEYRFGALNGVADDAHNCGRIKYARIEYAGYRIATDKELNGLSLGGCGSTTELDYIQIHGGNDDGIEFFGGTAGAKHLVLTGNDDDNVDWDLGWRGKLQFVVVQQHGVAASSQAENGIEADNDATAFANAPIAKPTIYNLTLIGANEGTKSRGMLLRRGTQGVLRNVLVQGFPVGAIDVRDGATVTGTTTGDLTVENSLFFQNGPGGNTPFPAETGTGDNDSGFDENAFFTAAQRQNRVNVDPLLGAPYNVTSPSFAPQASSPVTTGGATPPSDGFFDASATYVGAIGAGADWTVGWTAYPPVR